MEHESQPGASKSAPFLISVQQLAKYYYLGRTVVPALRGIDLEVKHGEFVALMGPSGSGKSTFMNLLGCLDRPTSGSYLFDGMPVSQMTTNQLADIRNHKIGFVFQGFNRATTARSHRSRAGYRTIIATGRRANRQPGQPYEHTGHGNPARIECARHHHPARHARG